MWRFGSQIEGPFGEENGDPETVKYQKPQNPQKEIIIILIMITIIVIINEKKQKKNTKLEISE